MKEKELKEIVKTEYGKIAKAGSSCCGTSSCCGNSALEEKSKTLGYSTEDLSSVPEGANLGLGCGNPLALSSLKEGEIVLDLGSGAGFDCFLASRKVGEKGKVYGVDMTPEMMDRANENKKKGGYTNVEFLQGELEKLPLPAGSVDVVISNCVINLVPDKKAVFSEIFRVLKPGGRFMISDIVLTRDLSSLPPEIINSVHAYVGCLSGAILADQYLHLLEKSGFKEVKIVEKTTFPLDYILEDPSAKKILERLSLSQEKAKEILDSFWSVRVSGEKMKE